MRRPAKYTECAQKDIFTKSISASFVHRAVEQIKCKRCESEEERRERERTKKNIDQCDELRTVVYCVQTFHMCKALISLLHLVYELY